MRKFAVGWQNEQIVQQIAAQFALRSTDGLVLKTGRPQNDQESRCLTMNLSWTI
jgi:hypothetical protein